MDEMIWVKRELLTEMFDLAVNPTDDLAADLRAIANDIAVALKEADGLEFKRWRAHQDLLNAECAR
jgi:hypothetical protein